MRVRLIKDIDSFGRESYSIETLTNDGIWHFVPGSVCLTEAEAKEKFDLVKKNGGNATKSTVIDEAVA